MRKLVLKTHSSHRQQKTGIFSRISRLGKPIFSKIHFRFFDFSPLDMEAAGKIRQLKLRFKKNERYFFFI